MPPFSMTGFGRGEASDDDYQVTVEVKTVNHRFKDIRFRMPSVFNQLELSLRKKIQEKFSRGSFDISVSYKKSEGKSKFDDVDDDKINAFLKWSEQKIKGDCFTINIDPMNFLKSEFLKENDILEDSQLNDLVRESFSRALEKLAESRASEGEKLKTILENHLEVYEKRFRTLEGLSDTYKSHVEERLRTKFKEISGELSVDEPRYMQEVVYYLEKLDVHEELNRIDAHLKKAKDLIQAEGEVGRQFEFLLQELNRETNTIGSKSALEEISNSVVAMKVQLEKMREQCLNIE